jgi:hypothetical protein
VAAESASAGCAPTASANQPAPARPRPPGKARSAQNARKHGLNVPVMYDPDVSVDSWRRTSRRDGQAPELIGRARRIAEAQVNLMRVARTRRDIISAAMADPDDQPVTSLTGRTATPGADGGAGKLAAILSDIGRAARRARLLRTRRAVASQPRRPRIRRGAPEDGAPTAAEQRIKIPSGMVEGGFVETN